MEYFFLTILKNQDFEEAITKTKKALKEEGFGVLTEIDMKATLKQKLDVDFHNYRILGALRAFEVDESISIFKIRIRTPLNQDFEK